MKEPAKKPAAKSAPAKAAPAKAAPTKAAPAKAAAKKDEPVKTAPAESASSKSAPGKSASAKSEMAAPIIKKPATKTSPAKRDGKKEGQSAFSKPLTPSKELSAVVGPEPLPRTEVVKKVWEYIKTHDLQNEANKREIVADAKLKAVFGRDKVTMFEMNKFLAAHLS